MSNVAAMFAATQFIEDHLRDPIGVADVATAVSYSLYHFSRMFNRVVHHPPYDYLMRRRLSASAQELLQTKTTITDVAFSYQFNNLETYSRAFKRVFGTQPSQWRQQGVWHRRQGLLPLTPAHLAYRAGLAPPALVEQPELTLAGLMSRVQPAGVEVASLWQILEKVSGQADAAHYGVFADAERGAARFYFAGFAGETAVAAHPLLVTKKMPAAQYACFHHPGPPAELPLLQDYVYQTWLPQSGYTLTFPLEIHRYTPRFSSSNTVEILIPISDHALQNG